MRLDQGLKDAQQRVITRLQLQTPANMQARDMTVCQMKMIINKHAHVREHPQRALFEPSFEGVDSKDAGKQL